MFLTSAWGSLTFVCESEGSLAMTVPLQNISLSSTKIP